MRKTNRQKKAVRVGIVGFIVNLALFLGEFTVGFFTNSAALIADSFTNLVDCVSSIATIVGFSFRSKKAEHAAGVFISLVIILTSITVGYYGFLDFLDPNPVVFSGSMVIICIIAIITNISLVIYGRRINKSVASATLSANILDSISDVATTLLTLTSIFIAPHTTLPVDGIFSMIIAVVILIMGLNLLKTNYRLLKKVTKR